MSEKTELVVFDEIRAGQYDEHLDRMMDAIDRRRKAIGQEKFAGLEPEDRVKITLTPNMRPRYLNGATGTVVEKRITKVVVRLDDDIDDPYGKWAGRRGTFHPSILQKIDD